LPVVGRHLSSFYAAGRAIGLAELGKLNSREHLRGEREWGNRVPRTKLRLQGLSVSLD
jgi:hypothetical protein